jgi:large subunit ribosomal protein L12e
MPPKPDVGEIKIVYIRQYGGEIGASSVLAPKVGPLGMSPKKVGEDIQKVSMDWKGIRITAKLTIQNRQAVAEIVPNAASLIIKELKEPLRDRKKTKNIKHNGNLTRDQILQVARTMRHKSQARTLKGTVKEVLGTAFSVGCTIDGKSAKDVQADVDSGVFDCPSE